MLIVNGQKVKVDKNKVYKVTFTHSLDDEDVIRDILTGRGFFKFKSFLLDLGYLCTDITEVIE